LKRALAAQDGSEPAARFRRQTFGTAQARRSIRSAPSIASHEREQTGTQQREQQCSAQRALEQRVQGDLSGEQRR
jgi:hypothetical protein